LRIVFIAAQLAAAVVITAGCSRPQDQPAPAATNAAAQVADSPGAPGSDQTLDQMLERTMNRFAKLDLNGDGKLTQDELNAATDGGDQTDNAQGRIRGGLSARAFRQADANGDGVITREEVEKQTRDQFKRLDANADGRVSVDELTANTAGRRARTPSGTDGQGGAAPPR
jgi:Ca2+-binding EF-hand superfamily protein